MLTKEKLSKTKFINWLQCTVNNAEDILKWREVSLQRAISEGNDYEVTRLKKEIAENEKIMELFNLYYNSLSLNGKSLVNDIRNYREHISPLKELDYYVFKYVKEECYQRYIDVMMQMEMRSVKKIDMKFVGRKLRQKREELGYSREDISRLLSITVSSVSNYENGIRSPNLNHMFALSKIYNLSIDSLLSS